MNTKHHILLALSLLLFTQVTIFSQKTEWIRVASDNGEFSIELPDSGRYFYDKDGFYFNDPMSGAFTFKEMQMLNAALDKTYMSVEIYRMPNAKGYLERISNWGGLAFTKIKTGEKDFVARKAEFDRSYEPVRKRTENLNFEVRYIASKTHFYIITVWNRGKNTPAAERLLASIKLGAENAPDAKSVRISAIEPVTLAQIGGQLSKDEIKALPEGSKFENGAPGQLYILQTPWSGFNFANVNSRAKGVVRLKVTYSKEGRIDKIALVSGLPGGLNRLAFFAVLRSKFLPAEKDGEPVTVEKVINYDYTTQF